jgi:prolyl-tRNA synthetase|tara:strand:- start:80780 stop:82234 length:1455 start_codon:yes stop_codon:yes gene_type:complete
MAKKARTAITPTRAEDFPLWYQEVVKAADMAENSPVRGCMIIKPYGYALWENMQRVFDGMIKSVGVENAYFPLLIPLRFIAKEADHIDGFAKECAVVTHHRLEANAEGKLVPAGELEEPYVIRPTSETIIGDSMSRWVQSYRDLPLKLNQWCNVMRWEMRTRLFLRTSEFLWQEGHNCFATAEEAREDALLMQEKYREFVEDYLALPVIKGEKTDDERFPGADATFTIEAMMQDGKALQAGTSHDLGQNFSKSSEITFQGRDGNEHHAHTTSWGISTRLVGGMIMTHADDDGMKMPPRVAPHQVTIIPIVKGDTDEAALFAYTDEIAAKLRANEVRVHIDKREETTPNKMWECIKKGVPIRVEVGSREMESGELTHVRRDIGRDSKETCSVDDFAAKAADILEDIQSAMFKTAQDFLLGNIHDKSSLDDVRSFFADDANVGFCKIDAALWGTDAFNALCDEFSLTPRCKPLDDGGKTVLIGKSY